MAENATRLTPLDQEEPQRQEKAEAERHRRLVEEAEALERESYKASKSKELVAEERERLARAMQAREAWERARQARKAEEARQAEATRKAFEASPEGQYQRGQELEKAGQMRPAMAAYRRAGEGGNPAAAKRMWELLQAQRESADDIAIWQRRALQLGAPGVPEPTGPTSR